MDMILVDVILLIILCVLTVFMCGYGVFCVYRLFRSMQMQILLRPTRVLFSHRKEGAANEELRTVVAYQNPFTGDYCIHKSRAGAQGYMNALHLDSPDSGMSDEYEPLSLEQPGAMPRIVQTVPHEGWMGDEAHLLRQPVQPLPEDNSVNKTWNWNYKEYQI